MRALVLLLLVPAALAQAEAVSPPSEGTILRRYQKQVQTCYLEALGRDPSLSGRVTLRFTIAPSGGVREPSAIGVEPALDRCIEGKARSWRFPARVEPARYEVSFLFKASEK